MGSTYSKDLLKNKTWRTGDMSNNSIILEILRTDLISCGHQAFCKYDLSISFVQVIWNNLTEQLPTTEKLESLTTSHKIKHFKDYYK